MRFENWGIRNENWEMRSEEWGMRLRIKEWGIEEWVKELGLRNEDKQNRKFINLIFLSVKLHLLILLSVALVDEDYGYFWMWFF